MAKKNDSSFELFEFGGMMAPARFPLSSPTRVILLLIILHIYVLRGRAKVSMATAGIDDDDDDV